MDKIALVLEELCSIEKLKLDLVLFGFCMYEVKAFLHDRILRIDPMSLKYKEGFYFKGGGNLNVDDLKNDDQKFYIKDENV